MIKLKSVFILQNATSYTWTMCVYGRCKIYDIGIRINSSSFAVAFFSYLLDAVSYAFSRRFVFFFFRYHLNFAEFLNTLFRVSIDVYVVQEFSV